MSEMHRLVDQLDRMRHNRLDNYIVPGLASELVGGTIDTGKVRLFTATRNARDWVTPHSHRFNFAALVLTGRVRNTLFVPEHGPFFTGSEEWCKSRIDQVCGANGIRKYDHCREERSSLWRQNTTEYGPGQTYAMSYEEIHSIQFDIGTQVLMLEGRQICLSSMMLEPWVNGKVIPTFKTESWMFERAP